MKFYQTTPIFVKLFKKNIKYFDVNIVLTYLYGHIKPIR